MNWQQLEQRIRSEMVPDRTRILKSSGDERRLVTSNSGREIKMRTGVETDSEKFISYEMLRHAFETLSRKGTFDSHAFRDKFEREYNNGQCRYSMTGGVLVELGVASRIPVGKRRCCYKSIQ